MTTYANVYLGPYQYAVVTFHDGRDSSAFATTLYFDQGLPDGENVYATEAAYLASEEGAKS